MTQVMAIAGTVTGMLTALALIGTAGVWLGRILRSLARLADDMLGEPARGLQPARPGVVDRLAQLEQLVRDRLDAMEERLRPIEERLAAVEAQLKPNGGSTLRDAVDRIAPSTKEA